ncbi:MAG: hypothetical protein NVS3B20_16110 [Polyangiales bacterium]
MRGAANHFGPPAQPTPMAPPMFAHAGGAPAYPMMPGGYGAQPSHQAGTMQPPMDQTYSPRITPPNEGAGQPFDYGAPAGYPNPNLVGAFDATQGPPPGASPGTGLGQGAGLYAQQKGATSFPTTCPNPACRRAVLVPPGGTAQCAFCGTLVDARGVALSELPAVGAFGLTGAVSEAAASRALGATAMAEGPNASQDGAPYGSTVALQGGFGNVRAVSLTGAAGTFRVLPFVESRVGRDGALCSIALHEPRVSGVHATLKIEGAMLLVRDDGSNNGTLINGNRIPTGTWTPVPFGSQLRFGPVEFVVRHEP